MPLLDGDGNERPGSTQKPGSGDTGAENSGTQYTGTVERKILPSSLDGKAYSSTPQSNTWIVIHNVGPGSADACYNTFVSNARNVSTHYTCDDKKVIQMLENNWKGKHVGGGSHCAEWPDAFTSGATNSNSIGIEVGNSGGGVSLDDNKAIEMGIELCRHLMKTLNIDIDHVVRHGDCQNKPCPSKIMELGKWNYFKDECVKRNQENKPVCFDASQLSSSGSGGGGGTTGGGGGGTSGGATGSTYGDYSVGYGYNTYHYGVLYPLDVIPNVDHRYNIANMDKVTGAVLTFMPPYNVCNLDQKDAWLKQWGWDKKYHYVIDPSYNPGDNPQDDVPVIEDTSETTDENTPSTVDNVNEGSGATTSTPSDDTEEEEEEDSDTLETFTETDFKNTIFVGDDNFAKMKDELPDLDKTKIFAKAALTVGKGRGEFSEGVLAAIDKIEEGAHIVVFGFGMNDSEFTKTEGFITNYKNFINDVKNHSANAKIFIMKIFPGNADKANEMESDIIANIPAHNDAINAICSETGATLLDCTNIEGLQDYYEDGLIFKGEFFQKLYDDMKEKIMSSANTPSTEETGSTVQIPSEDNHIKIQGGFQQETNRLLQCYSLSNDETVTYINRALFKGKPTAHCIMIGCFIPGYDDLLELGLTWENIEQNIINAVSKILWANGLKTEDLWREFDLNRAPSPLLYLERDKWKRLLNEIDKQLDWRNKNFGTVTATYTPYEATVPSQTINVNSGGTPGGSTPDTGSTPDIGNISDNAQAVWTFFTGGGFSPQCTAGIMGNLQQESGLDPNSHQSGGGKGRGIAQWSVNESRHNGLIEYAKGKGKEWTDLQCQLEWIVKELQENWIKKVIVEKAGSYETWQQMTDINKACDIFEAAFERAGKPMMEKRYQYAQQFYNKFSTSSTATTTATTFNLQSRATQNLGTGSGGGGSSTSTNGGFSWPTPGVTKVSSKFGPRKPPCAGASSNHGGIDISAPKNTDVCATLAGTVTLSKYSSSAGNYIVLDHGNGYGSRYLHLDKALVKVGDKVQQNQVIAKSGNTGVGTGAHLHFEIQSNFPSGGTSGTKVDPLKYVQPGVTYGSAPTNIDGGDNAGPQASLDKVLLVGDSLTEGIKSTLTGKYPGATAAAKPGKWATQWLDDLGSLPSADKVSCVIQWIGINGVHNNKKNISDSQTLLTKLKEKYPGVPVFNMNIFPTSEEYSYGDYTGEWWRGLSQEFNTAMSSWCSSNGVTQIDATNGFIQTDGFLDPSKAVDGIHFTSEGYKQVLSNIETAIGSYNSSNSGTGGGMFGGGSYTINAAGVLIASHEVFGKIENPGPAAALPYTGNSMGGMSHKDWGGKMTYEVGDAEGSSEKPEIVPIISSEQYQEFCDTFYKGESYQADGTIKDVYNFQHLWDLIDVFAGENEPYDKGIVEFSDATVTENDRWNSLSTTFTTKNNNTVRFNVIEAGPGSKDHCVKAADELNIIMKPADLKCEPIYPDLIIPPQYVTADADLKDENMIPLSMLHTFLEENGDLSQIQLEFDYELLKDKVKKTENRLAPINFLDPYPTDDKIRELEEHQPKVFIDEIESQIYSCNHPGCPIAQPMAKNFAMLQDGLISQAAKTESRLVRLENILSTIMRNQARLGSRVNINCVYYGGQSTINGKYSCIRCLHDDRINDGAIVTIDQCLNCTRYEPILGQIYKILDESGTNGSIVLDDMQMSYSDLEMYQRLNKQTERSPVYDYVDVMDENVGFKPEQTRVQMWRDAHKNKYLESHKDDPLFIETDDRAIQEAQEAKYLFRMDWRETFLNHQEPDIKPYPLEGIIKRYKKEDGDGSYEELIANLDPEKDKDAIEDAQRALLLMNGEWIDTKESSDTVKENKYSSENFYFEKFAEIKKFTGGIAGFGDTNLGGGSPGAGISSDARNKIVEMAETIYKECEAGKAWYSQPYRTTDYTKPTKMPDGRTGYDCSSLCSCCYKHAGLTSLTDKTCSGGGLVAEVVKNPGEMWLLNDEGISKALPGDVIMVATRKVSQADMGKQISTNHVMVYIGNGQLIHAAGKDRGIRKEEIADWRKTKGTHFFMRPADLQAADKAASAISPGGGSGGGVSEESGSIDGKNYIAKIPGAVVTCYTDTGTGASGMGCEYNKTCASHNMPYGTKIYIPQLNGTCGDGVFTVTDVGGCFFDFDICTNASIGKKNMDAYVIEWGTKKVANSYTWAIDLYNSRGTWDRYKSAWDLYKTMGGKLISFTKYNQEDANITSHKNYNDK